MDGTISDVRTPVSFFVPWTVKKWNEIRPEVKWTPSGLSRYFFTSRQTRVRCDELLIITDAKLFWPVKKLLPLDNTVESYQLTLSKFGSKIAKLTFYHITDSTEINRPGHNICMY